MTTTRFANDILHSTAIRVVDCAECAVTFGLSDEFINRRREDHRSFYCPNGHSLSYRAANEAEQLRNQLQWAREQRDAARALAQRESNRARAYKGQATKVKRRISKGVCPCCNRQFQNLADHMENKHPDYAAEASS